MSIFRRSKQGEKRWLSSRERALEAKEAQLAARADQLDAKEIELTTRAKDLNEKAAELDLAATIGYYLASIASWFGAKAEKVTDKASEEIGKRLVDRSLGSGDGHDGKDS